MKSREEFIKNLGDDASMDDELSAIAESGGNDVEDMRSKVESVKSKKKSNGLPYGVKAEEITGNAEDNKRLTPRMKAFASNVVQGMSPKEAYRRAYECENSSEATIQKNANALLKDRRITLLLESFFEDLQENVITDQVHARRHIMKQLFKHANDKNAQLSNRLKSLELMGRAIGMFTDKVEQKVEEVSVDQLKKELESSLHLLESTSKRQAKPH